MDAVLRFINGKAHRWDSAVGEFSKEPDVILTLEIENENILFGTGEAMPYEGDWRVRHLLDEHRVRRIYFGLV